MLYGSVQRQKKSKNPKKMANFPSTRNSLLSCAMMGVAVVFSDYVYNFWHREMIFIEILPRSKIKQHSTTARLQ